MLGIPPEQERLYVALIARPGASLAELADFADVALATAAAQLDELVAHGLALADGVQPGGALEDGDTTRTFRASSPSVALLPLLVRRRAMLDRTEAAVMALVDHYRSLSSPAAGSVVEVVHGVVGTRHRFTQLLGGARREVLLFASEAVVAVDRESADPMVEDVLRRGAELRTVISRQHLQGQGMMAAALESVQAGVQVRVAEEIPLRMLVCDRSNALLPLSLAGDGEADSLVIHGTALVQALALLFEQYWRRAHPVFLDDGTFAGQPVPSGPTAEDRLILSLLSLGLSDRKIAAQLTLSLRTVERRIRALMDRADAQSRFQLGCHAARHGWLPETDGMAAG
ncbi:LuxR C-terminal-related transcriptional regulator [Streptomyces odontomachi]|uniref:LuxR C-terminal-related transcriptional regulator n=1 Tax=Streptomyces odontomachi TaxID=2944940 RepID=UPI0021091796|nr:LuxR C-terminal-related transcriptional regulator [Streptomyces sp. ODS25]